MDVQLDITPYAVFSSGDVFNATNGHTAADTLYITLNGTLVTREEYITIQDLIKNLTLKR
jgi:hypothetical protein